MFSPIILFAFNRPLHTYKTLKSLAKNQESIESYLIVYLDGPKSPVQINQINNVEKVILGFKENFKKININKSEINLGLDHNIRRGISEVLKVNKSVIVLEDDVNVSPYFLKYMNQAINLYEDKKNIWHINGFNFPITRKEKQNSYFTRVMFCWGWATWQDRWQKYMNDPLYHDPFFIKEKFDKKLINEFELNSKTNFWWSQINKNILGKLNWDIFWYSYIFLNNGLCLTPTTSLTRNIGNDGSGINCDSNNEIQNAFLSNNPIDFFPEQIIEDEENLILMKNYLKKTYNLRAKVFRKIINLLSRYLKLKGIIF